HRLDNSGKPSEADEKLSGRWLPVHIRLRRLHCLRRAANSQDRHSEYAEQKEGRGSWRPCRTRRRLRRQAKGSVGAQFVGTEMGAERLLLDALRLHHRQEAIQRLLDGSGRHGNRYRQKNRARRQIQGGRRKVTANYLRMRSSFSSGGYAPPLNFSSA